MTHSLHSDCDSVTAQSDAADWVAGNNSSVISYNPEIKENGASCTERLCTEWRHKFAIKWTHTIHRIHQGQQDEQILSKINEVSRPEQEEFWDREAGCVLFAENTMFQAWCWQLLLKYCPKQYVDNTPSYFNCQNVKVSNECESWHVRRICKNYNENSFVLQVHVTVHH